MLETLTVELDSAVVEHLRRYCREHGVTVAEVLTEPHPCASACRKLGLGNVN